MLLWKELKFNYSTCNLKISENETFCDWNPVLYQKLQTFAVLELKIHLSAYLSTTGRASCGWNPAHGTVMYAFLASVPCVLWNVKYTCIVYFLWGGSIALWTNPACGKTQIHQLLVLSLRAGLARVWPHRLIIGRGAMFEIFAFLIKPMRVWNYEFFHTLLWGCHLVVGSQYILLQNKFDVIH